MRGRKGFGILSPSRRACEARFGAFVKIECLFFIMSEESFGEVVRVLAKKRSLDAEVDSVECWTYI